MVSWNQNQHSEIVSPLKQILPCSRKENKERILLVFCRLWLPSGIFVTARNNRKQKATFMSFFQQRSQSAFQDNTNKKTPALQITTATTAKKTSMSLTVEDCTGKKIVSVNSFNCTLESNDWNLWNYQHCSTTRHHGWICAKIILWRSYFVDVSDLLIMHCGNPEFTHSSHKDHFMQRSNKFQATLNGTAFVHTFQHGWIVNVLVLDKGNVTQTSTSLRKKYSWRSEFLFCTQEVNFQEVRWHIGVCRSLVLSCLRSFKLLPLT